MKLALSLLTATGLVLACLTTGSLAASKSQMAGTKKAARIQPNCNKLLPLFNVAESSANQKVNQTNPPTPADLNGSAISFRVLTLSCVLVDFSASVSVGQGHMLVRAVLDDTDVSLDGDIIFDEFTAGAQITHARAYNFLFMNVPPGKHTVKMQGWVDGFSGVSATVYNFNMVVRHR